MKSLTDQELMTVYEDAVELQLEKEFLDLLLLEIHARGLKPGQEKQEKEQHLLMLGSTK
ncbi:sporulation histidine kinase inhibitor Sda [Paenibacillus sp. SYP-B4298]|uniref:sporulation histidine kinase inhibitor Sda n=1 Tax=Paenibacillus sp. SYP-B4298 TaxID=2996034 RepID=UPI0022DD8A66|nr:sporulation histidine kinase inhibitor Sda [Paenibacillus sp. SYP-B4298]